MAVQDISVKHYESMQTGSTSLSGTVGATIAVIDSCISGFGSVTLTSLVVASNIATATVNTGHGFTIKNNLGPVIEIAGSTPSSLNGKWRIKTMASANVFTFEVSGIADQTASGTITAKIAGAELTKAFSGTNKAAYRFNDITGTRRYLRVDDSNALYSILNLYETMSDVDTGTNGAALVYFTKSDAASSSARPWRVVMNNTTLYMFNKYNNSTWRPSFAFGDLIPVDGTDTFHAVLFGQNSTGATGTYFGAFNVTTGHYIMRDYGQTGSAVSAKAYSHYLATVNYTGYGTLLYPSPSNDFLFSNIQITNSAGTVIRGTLPGIYAPLQAGSNFTYDSIIDSIATMPNATLIIQGHYTTNGRVAIDLMGPWL